MSSVRSCSGATRAVQLRSNQGVHVHGGEIQIRLCSHCDARFEPQQAVLAASLCLHALSCCLVISCFLLTAATLSALFPAANRLKRDSANVTESMFHHSVEDVGLLFEVETI